MTNKTKHFDILKYMGIRSVNSIKSMTGFLKYYQDSNGNTYHSGSVHVKLRNKKVFAFAINYHYGYGDAFGCMLNDLGLTNDQQSAIKAKRRKSYSNFFMTDCGVFKKAELRLVEAGNKRLEYIDVRQIRNEFYKS